ncbi:MAG TPA: transglycosylase domain-containing protein [Actinocrinis sp.]|nr:transglycosylase domain-containing protein [Actinocrinis sp.]
MVKARTGYSGVIGAGRLISQLVTFLVVSSLAGVLLAGVALPFVGSAGLATKAASDHFEDLPSDFQAPALPQRSEILASDGSLIANIWDTDSNAQGNRVVVPWSQINPTMPDALVAIEDQRYYQHGGIDIKGTIRATFNDSQSGSNLQGGSSIAQQYIKNELLLEAGSDPTLQKEATADTFSRKITELKDAITVSEEMSKNEILQNYLNLVYFGNGAYGVEAAAEEYFSTTSDKLTAPQSALLAAIVNSPDEFNPITNGAAALTRRNTVLEKMADPSLNYLTPAQAAADEKLPLGLNVTKPQEGCITASGSAAFFCHYVYDEFLQDSAYGATTAQRLAMWNLGGLVIHTTMSVQDEQASDKAIQKYVYPTDKVASSMVMIQPGTGAILAMAQSQSYGSGVGQTYLNLSGDPQHDGTSGFQAGSSFKIFTGVSALQQGISPGQLIQSPLTVDDVGQHFATCENGKEGTYVWTKGSTANNTGISSDSGSGGDIGMAEGFAQSVNTYFIRLEELTGLCGPATVAQSMGVTQDSDNGTGKALIEVPTLTLGVNEITPIEMADAYATLAAQGKYCTPIVISGITDFAGKQYPGQSPTCKQVIDPNIANELTSLLKGVVTNGTGAGVNWTINRPFVGKTGTTDSGVDTWFDGYTPNLAAATWTGFINPNSKTHLKDIRIGSTTYDGQIFGATISAPMFNIAMTAALKGMPVQNFTPASGYNNTPNPPPTAPGGGGNGGNGGNGGGNGGNAGGNGGTGGNGGGNGGTGGNGNGGGNGGTGNLINGLLGGNGNGGGNGFQP